MVRLDMGKTRKSMDTNQKAEEPQANLEVKQQNANSELEKFSQYVIKVLIDENIPTTPYNFQIYFDKLLDNKPVSFKKRVNELLDLELASNDEHRAKIEIEIKEGFNEIKSIMNVASAVYKNLNIMEKILHKRQEELQVSSGQLALVSISSTLIEDLKKLSGLMSRQMETLKTHYDKTSVILKDIESKAIFDSRYGIYNKRFLLEAIVNENKSMEQFGHKSTLVLARIKKSMLGQIANAKDRSILSRNVAKLLLKTSRRSDVVAHYGGGIFGMLMKHTDIGNAKRACERINDLIYSTSFFIGESEMQIDLELVIVPIAQSNLDVALLEAIDLLVLSGKNEKPYIIYEKSQRSTEEIES